MISKNFKNSFIVVGMSGGVDSSMALVLLKKQGWQPVGVSLKYAVWQSKVNLLRENVCCSAESFKIAEAVCKKLGVPYYIFDVAESFKKEVIDYFVSELKDNKTPNPCILCNRYLKFKKLFEWAKENNIKYVATGHYARVRKNPITKKYELLRAKDKNKDQTYSLCFLTQEWLRNIILPLGNYTKSEIYKMAKREGFQVFLKRKQSQDFCFVAGKSIGDFLKKEIGQKQGLIKDTKGEILGKHRGLHFYTIGQRKGINLSEGPYFVVDKDIKNNILIVSKNQQDLYSKKAVLSPYHFISEREPIGKTEVEVKIRSQHTPAKATLLFSKKGEIELIFNKPQKSITPGQFAVFYLPAEGLRLSSVECPSAQAGQNDICLGGGKIL